MALDPHAPDTSRPLKAAVVGCGRMGAFTSQAVRRFAPAAWLPLSHAEAIKAQPELVLAGLCDPAPEALRAAGERYSGVACFQDHHDMLRSLQPEILSVATRTPERPSVVVDAVAAGVRGLHLEKPLCNSLAQLEALERLLAGDSVSCTFGALRRYMPVYERARTEVANDRLGALRQITIGMGSAGLFWTHPHSIDLVLFFAGSRRVKQVCARFAEGSFERRGAVLDGDPMVLSALIEFQDGTCGVITQAGGCDVVLACANGLASVESDGRRLSFREANGDGPYWDKISAEVPDDRSGGTRLALDRLVRHVKGDDPDAAAYDKRQILFGQRLLLACVQSHLEGGSAVDPGRLDPELAVTGRSGGRFA